MNAGGRIVLVIILGPLILAASFWFTLQFIDYLRLPPNAAEIHVIDATYGLNCRNFVVGPGQVNRVKPGNATQMALQLCHNAKGSCVFPVDVSRMGDPAPGCRKDFSLQWHCGDMQKTLEAYLPDEANGLSATATCP